MLIQGKNEEMGGGLQDSRFEAVQRRLSKEKEAWLEDVPGLRSKFGRDRTEDNLKTRRRACLSMLNLNISLSEQDGYFTSLHQLDHMMSSSGMRSSCSMINQLNHQPLAVGQGRLPLCAGPPLAS